MNTCQHGLDEQDYCVACNPENVLYLLSDYRRIAFHSEDIGLVQNKIKEHNYIVNAINCHEKYERIMQENGKTIVKLQKQNEKLIKVLQEINESLGSTDWRKPIVEQALQKAGQ